MSYCSSALEQPRRSLWDRLLRRRDTGPCPACQPADHPQHVVITYRTPERFAVHDVDPSAPGWPARVR